MKKASKKTFILLSSILIVMAGIAFALADRYLIRHVQIADVSIVSAVAETTDIPVVSSYVADAVLDTESSFTAATEPTQAVTYDDWNYSDGNVTISITENSSGSGDNALTYFVADVVLSDATDLSNAFADDQFGTNIIDTTSQIAAVNDAIFAINGDYYGFREDGIIIRNGVIYRDVPVRTGLAFSLDGTMNIYDETQTSAQELLDQGVWNTYSFGPALITDSVVASNFETVKVDNNFGNHPIDGSQPRTGIGMIDANHYVFIVVDGRSTGYSTGVTLEVFAQMFADLGCRQAYNLDGGGSSTMYFMSRVVNNPLGRERERGTSDILMIGG